MYSFTETAKFLNLAFKIDKLQTKYKNSALFLRENAVTFYTLRSIHKTVGLNVKKQKRNEVCFNNIDSFTIDSLQLQ